MTDRRQRQKQARTAAREAERRAAARREMRRRIVVGLGLGATVAVALLLIGTFSDAEDLPEALAAFRDQPTACDGSPPEPPTAMSFDSPINQALRADSTVTATVETTCGPIVIDLSVDEFPQTVNSFVFLARNGFYDGIAVHRIAADFVIQSGDPLANGTGGPGYTIPDEFPSPGFVYEPGVVAMANSGRGTTGSQFFIVTGDAAASLNPSFNVLGRVIDGFDTLDRIEQVRTRRQSGLVEQSLPVESVYLESVTITVER